MPGTPLPYQTVVRVASQLNWVNKTTVACTTTPVKALSQNLPGRVGVTISNPTAVTLYVAVVDTGATAPTFTTMVTNGESVLQVLTTEVRDLPVSYGQDVYLVLASGTGNAVVWEVS